MKKNQSQKISPVDAFFNAQKEKINILAEIFNNKDFFLKDFIIKEILTKRTVTKKSFRGKITKKGFAWLKKRIEELKSGQVLIPAN